MAIWTNKQYLAQLPEEYKQYSWYTNVGLPYRHYTSRPIASGLLKFNEDTACIWGGPWPGNFCGFEISEVISTEKYTLRSIEDYLEAYFDRELKSDYSSLKKYRLTHSKAHSEKRAILKQEWLDYKLAPHLTRKEFLLSESPTIERPIKFYCYGTDDTTYSNHFHTEGEALEVLELLGSVDELDFWKDFEPFGFVFTN